MPAPRIAWRRERWDTPDGDFIDLDWAGTEGPLIALFHGLEGSSASPYARAIAAQASGAESAPLNESGARTIFIAPLYRRQKIVPPFCQNRPLAPFREGER